MLKGLSVSKIEEYSLKHETELLSLLAKEPDWHSFVREEAINQFKESLLSGGTFGCLHNASVCGYVRVLVDPFGVYVSELYVTPNERNNGYGKALLDRVKSEYSNIPVYVLSDEDRYYEKHGFKPVGSVFQL